MQKIASCKALIFAYILPCVAALSFCSPCSANPPEPLAGWVKTFEDNFDGTSLDTTKWNTGYGWGREMNWSGEYSAPENVSVGDGVCTLKLENRKHPSSSAGHDFTSGGINTKNKFTPQFGYFEARIKMAKGKGFLNAFWGKRNDESWPPEIDITEVKGNEINKSYTTVHYSPNNSSKGKASTTADSADLSADYHIYGCEWTPTETVYYLDGVECYRTSAGASELAASGKPFYWMLNVHIGNDAGDWAGTPDSTTPWPSYMKIDWVRGYRRILSNPNFEWDGCWTQTPTGWVERFITHGNSASFVENANGGHNSAYHASHWATSPYNVYTYQFPKNIPNGVYTLSAWIKSSGGQNECNMYASNYGGTTIKRQISASPNWTQIFITGINITNTQCEVGFHSDSPSGSWLTFDDVQFFKQ